MSDDAPLRAVGIDIGGSSVKAAVLMDDGAWRTAQSDRYERPDCATLQDAIAACMRALGASIQQRVAMGLCAPGMRDAKGFTVLESVNVPALNGLDLRELVDNANPVIIGDAEAAAIDLQQRRGDRGRLLLLALGTGVGACVLDGHTPLRVSGAGPGHFGQIDVSLSGDVPAGPDGGRGGLEAYVGARALIRRFGSDESALSDGLRTDDTPIRALARALRIAHAIYRPSVICLAGGVGLLMRPHLPALDAMVRTGLTSVAERSWVVECADDAFHAARGTAARALHQHEPV